MQYSIIQKSDIDQAKRFDAEYFKPEYLEVERKLKSHKKILNDFGVQILHPSEIKRSYIQKGGILFVRTQNVRPLRFDLTNKVYISKKDAKKLQKNEILKEDILMTRTGANFGQTCLFNEDYKAIASSHTFIIKHGELNPYFLSIFFNSKHGRKMIDKGMYGGLQPEITPLHLLKIPLLDFPHSFQLQIEQIVKDAHHKQTQSKDIYAEAEQILLTELGLLDFIPQHHLTFTTTKGEVEQAKRFDAEYFQPKYQEIIERIEQYEGGVCEVGNFNFNKKNFYPENNKEYYYIPLSKVSNNGEIEKGEKELGKDLPTRARRKVKAGEVILSSIEGSLETSALIQDDQAGFIVSNGFYVFSSDKINSETLFVLVKSQIFIELLRKISKGAILGGYDLESFKTIKIPLIHPETQTQIAEKITRSHQLRKESKELLKQAKKRVEEEIEEGGKY